MHAKRIRELWVIEHRHFEQRTIGKVTDWGSQHMTKWDGGETHDGKCHSPVWPKILQFTKEHNLQPETLVRAMFYRKALTPTPSQACGQYALDQYQIYTSPGTKLEMKNELIHGFESQKQRALSEVFTKTTYYKLDEKTAWQVVVGSNVIPLTPLFKYCVARNQGWNDIADEYCERASAQYQRQADLYNEVWADWIPADFRDRRKT